MTVSVVVPFRPDHAERSRNWAWLRDRLTGEHPGWEIVEATCGEGRWNKPAAVNRAVRASTGDVLVISDADVFVTAQALRAAVAQARHAPWVVPHDKTYRLAPQATIDVIGGAEHTKAKLATKPSRKSAGGGLVVLARRAFEAAGGMDERFQDWGYEDVSFGKALDTLAGPHRRLDARLYHLWHPPSADRPVESLKLYRRYVTAYGSVRRMRALVAGGEAAELVPLAAPAVFRAAVPTVRIGGQRGQTIRFHAGRFETTDPDIAGALRLAKGVTELAG